jgi:beta-glucosidase/6-phospho-beta-glucosidase/beta-galactosidase
MPDSFDSPLYAWPSSPERYRQAAGRPLARSHLFRSFWMAGFESAGHINQAGTRLDLIAATQHDRFVDEDYARLAEWGIRTVREGLHWHLIESGGDFDFSTLLHRLEAAQRHGIQIIWNLCHYGWPDGLDVLSPAFVDRFARYCGAVARVVSDHSDRHHCYTPINEVSFLAWAAGEKGYFYPHRDDAAALMKHQLVRASIHGIEEIWRVDRGARIMLTDPIIHVVTPRGRPELARAAAEQREGQFEVWDMMAGALAPELGGHSRYLDVIGVNYYHANQWEHPDQRLRWEDTPRDPRWMPFSALLAEMYYRYWRPVVVSETSHFGSGRARWIREVAEEVAHARQMGVQVEGLCLYPIIDRPDWEDPDHWHNSGLWDLRRDSEGRLERVLCQDYADELRRVQQRLGGGPL